MSSGNASIAISLPVSLVRIKANELTVLSLCKLCECLPRVLISISHLRIKCLYNSGGLV